MLSFFPLDVLDEIWSVSEGFLTLPTLNIDKLYTNILCVFTGKPIVNRRNVMLFLFQLH